MHVRLLAPVVAVAALAVGAPPASAASAPATILRLTEAAACIEPATLLTSGARLVDAKLRLWRLEPALAASILPALERRGAVAATQREQTYDVAATTATPDPLQASRW